MQEAKAHSAYRNNESEYPENCWQTRYPTSDANTARDSWLISPLRAQKADQSAQAMNPSIPKRPTIPSCPSTSSSRLWATYGCSTGSSIGAYCFHAVRNADSPTPSSGRSRKMRAATCQACMRPCTETSSSNWEIVSLRCQKVLGAKSSTPAAATSVIAPASAFRFDIIPQTSTAVSSPSDPPRECVATIPISTAATPPPPTIRRQSPGPWAAKSSKSG